MARSWQVLGSLPVAVAVFAALGIDDSYALAHLLHQGHIIPPAVIVIAGKIARGAARLAGHSAKVVPNTGRATLLVPRALNLVAGSGDSPDKRGLIVHFWFLTDQIA